MPDVRTIVNERQLGPTIRRSGRASSFLKPDAHLIWVPSPWAIETVPSQDRRLHPNMTLHLLPIHEV
jgi:hypothetical protein